MTKIILQPAGDKDAIEHYKNTIENPVQLSKIRGFVSKEIAEKLHSLFPNDLIPVWGVTSGKNDGNKHKWERIETGDITLFSRNKFIFVSATIAFTIHNKELALRLWDTNDEGETWEYIYFLDEVTNQHISYERFNKVVGYKENNIIQGFNVLDIEKSTLASSLLDLKSEIYFPEVSKEEYYKAISEPGLDQPLDKVGQAKLRTEQGYLRSYLFRGKKVDKCGICGREYPVNFLIASHIKKRADCSEEEKRDYENIAMPMCKFGCDDLYEMGYISVINGKISANNKKYVTTPIKEYLSNIINLDCSYWSDGAKKYFLWHSELHKHDL